jgi:HEAT repeat protein
MKKRPSEPTAQLIESLHAKRRLWDKLAHPDVEEEIIRKIGDSGEPEAIPDLLPILMTGNRRSVLACAQAIQRLLMQLKPADFARFDECVRQGYYNWDVPREPWYCVKPVDVAHLANVGDASASVLGIASCHMNGYVREAALRELGKIDTGAELPFLLLRANDWVGSIRLCARDLLRSRVLPDYARHFLDWLPLVLRLSKTSRDDQSWILDAVRSLVQGSEVRKTLYEGFESQDYRVRRFCFELGLRLSASDFVAVMQRAFENKDPMVRKAAVLQLGVALPNNQLKEFLVRARNDAWMPVRREALRIYSQKYHDEAEKEFRSALLDSNVAIREEAQYYFRKMGNLALRSYYTEVLQTSAGAKLSAAVGGLGEVGEQNDTTLLERFIFDPSARVRVAAVHGIARLNPNAYLEQFLRAMDDPSAKVAREGLLALSKRPNLVTAERFWEVFSHSRHLHGKRSALHLLARVNKWDSIAFLIQSLADDDNSVVELGKKYIMRWFARYNRSFVTPNPSQTAKLRQILGKFGLLLGSGTQQRLELLLKSF